MKTLILILSLIAATSAKAQSSEYRTTMDTNSTRFVGKRGQTLVTMNFSLNRGRTAAIKGHTYIKGRINAHYVLNNDSTVSLTEHYYRQEDGKIYYWSGKEDEEEILLMDFDLNVGDEFVYPNGNTAKVVEKKDTVMGYTNRKLTLEGVSNHSFHDVWLEGMGSMTNGLLPPSFVEDVEKLTLYWTDFRGFFNKFNEPFVNNDLVKTSLVLPEQVLDMSDVIPWACEFVDDSLRLAGSNTQGILDQNLFFAFLNGADIYIEHNVLPGYVGSDKNKLVDVKLGTFKPGTYNIHYSTFYEVFNQCHIDTTVVCQGDLASVPDIQPNPRMSASHAIYDLTGRRLTAEPTRGVYIRDGKKVWKVKN